MFCPKCGSNQSENRKFCTHCGTNLNIVSQALTGQISQPAYVPPPINPSELQRRHELAKGYRFTIIGSGFIAFSFANLIFTGSFFGFWSFLGLIFLAVGISRVISYKSPLVQNSADLRFQNHQANPAP